MSDQAEPVMDEVEEEVAVESVAEVVETAVTEDASKDEVAEQEVADVLEEVAVIAADSENSIENENAVASMDEAAPIAEAASTDEAVSAEEVVSSDEAAPTEDVASSNQVAEESASEKSEASSAAGGGKDTDGKRVVRVLSVGQEVPGIVKRISDFGAFVDIGVGRDGLLHVSELSTQRVNKVSDILSKGLEITVWIKQLDRERNRISLTMISPDTKTIRDLSEGELVEGTVTRMLPYGVFIDIGVGREALLHVREMGEGYIKRPEDVLQMGEKLEARIISVSRRRNRIDLSIKGLRPEPEAEEPKATAPTQEEEVYEDQFEEVEVLSAIELAFKKAMGGGTGKVSKKARKNRKNASRTSLQDDIIARTLSND